MWELNYKKKAERRRIDAFELWCWRRLESPLDCKEIQPVHPKGDQSCVFIGRPDVEAETLILWPPHAEGWLIWKDPGAGKDWGQEEKGMTENEMVGWHHWHNRHGFGWTLGVGDGQGGLACCHPWGHKELDMTERLNWTELNCWITLSAYWNLFLIDPTERKEKTPAWWLTFSGRGKILGFNIYLYLNTDINELIRYIS